MKSNISLSNLKYRNDDSNLLRYIYTIVYNINLWFHLVLTLFSSFLRRHMWISLKCAKLPKYMFCFTPNQSIWDQYYPNKNLAKWIQLIKIKYRIHWNRNQWYIFALVCYEILILFNLLILVLLLKNVMLTMKLNWRILFVAVNVVIELCIRNEPNDVCY